jgi:hypothetical protein
MWMIWMFWQCYETWVSLPRFKGPSVSCTIWQCNFNGWWVFVAGWSWYQGYMNLKPGVPDKMCMLYWRGSHFFTVILDIQRKHITCESFASSNESVIRALLSGSRRLFWNSTSQKGLFSFSDIDSSDYTFSIVHNAQSGARMWMVGFVISFLDDAGQRKHRVVFTRNIDILQSM